MNFLYAAVLSIVFVGSVAGTVFSETELGKAIENGNLETAVRLASENSSLRIDGMEYAVTHQAHDFVANFINQTNQANRLTLRALSFYKPTEFISKVLERVKFRDEDLIGQASDVLDTPDKFLVILNKISTPEGQEAVVQKVIQNLDGRNFGTVESFVRCHERQIISKRTFGRCCNPKRI